jgi:catechol 2,3-dioxygenase
VIAPSTHIGAVHVSCLNVDRAVRFYEERLGLVHRHSGETAVLGAAGRDLLVLDGSASSPRAPGTTGLYHFAILVPSRAHLARALRRLAGTGTPLQGAADHGVSESLYLADPEGNGIEIYRDRPRAEWPIVDGRLRMRTDPLDLDALLDQASSGDDGMAAGTTMGHVHLQVSDLGAAERFYVGVLGFELMQRYGPSALFVAAGGYHHHIGMNTWAGAGAPPPAPGSTGLRYAEIVLPSRASRDDVVERVRGASIPVDAIGDATLIRDPSDNGILLVIK